MHFWCGTKMTPWELIKNLFRTKSKCEIIHCSEPWATSKRSVDSLETSLVIHLHLSAVEHLWSTLESSEFTKNLVGFLIIYAQYNEYILHYWNQFISSSCVYFCLSLLFFSGLNVILCVMQDMHSLAYSFGIHSTQSLSNTVSPAGISLSMIAHITHAIDTSGVGVEDRLYNIWRHIQTYLAFSL